jgi:hypothetical protein
MVTFPAGKLRNAPSRWPWASVIEIGSLQELAPEVVGVAAGVETGGAWLQAMNSIATSAAHLFM